MADETQGKWTPGPWISVEDEDGSSNPSICIEAEDWGIVCDIGGGKLGMRRANARLIESAPALLESLRDVVSLLEMDPECRPGTDTYTAVEVAKLVIAKATGQPAP